LNEVRSFRRRPRGARRPRRRQPGYADYIDYVCEAEALGFHSVFIVEHHFTGHGQVSASLNVLSYLAARTSRIRLGTAVVVLPWHNPVLIAEQAATLDLLSGGRFDFGVGKGYREAEFAGFCIAPDEATERFDEAMAVIRKAWSGGGRFSHHGKRWHYENVVVEPTPKQRPHPPFWLGAGSEESIRRAAREGYNLLLDQLGPIDLTVARVAAFRAECAHVGRFFDPLTIGVTRGLQILRHESEREAAIATRFDVLKAIGGLARGTGAETYRRIAEQGAVHEFDDAALLGTPAEIVARLRRLEAGGVALVLLVDPRPSLQTLRFFAREIMPAFAAAATAAQ
jgi:alkanesulfonate monooxygenase SsuD/methylene tetrahydromethanopterin reductase-like flavin-dependent oxidoreductase (luciferase family)